MSSPDLTPPSSPEGLELLRLKKLPFVCKKPLAECRAVTPTEGPAAASTSQKSLESSQRDAVVMDTGTGICKAGFAGEFKPSVVMESVVSYPLEQSKKTDQSRASYFVGELAWDEPNVRVVELVKLGNIIDWEAAETLWRHIFDHDLKVSPEEHSILLSDPPLSPASNREKMAEIFFESLGCPSMCVTHQSVLSAYSYGKISGLVVESGHGVTSTVPVLHGNIIPHAIERMYFAGKLLTESMQKMLSKSGHSFDESMILVVEDIKHRCCYVAEDYESEMSLPESDCEIEYTLPDGQDIIIGKESFQCPEELFRPAEVVGDGQAGIHIMAQNSLTKVPEEHKKVMYGNVLLCGGSTLFHGFYNRICTEFEKWLSQQYTPETLSIPDREHSTWIGGSILSSLRAFQSCWIPQQMYKEHGPSIMRRKC
ncbi:actin-like protein 9 [Ambystoma mexicanum]|uniref:actin-like protein 9 n=1 Tax=Ambystoma mexicanum TaxID=8296 RepID=UPI0037E99602